jgi:hypothetical protein
MSRDVAPPSGWPAPRTATLAGRSISLVPLAEATADRYFEEFPEDLERYGDAARAWEVHDTLHCLHWAVLDVEEIASLEREVAWLTNVLRSRGFPLDHLARNLDLAAVVVDEQLAEGGSAVAERLRTAAAGVPSA